MTIVMQFYDMYWCNALKLTSVLPLTTLAPIFTIHHVCMYAKSTI
jgi:hypothetical protein